MKVLARRSRARVGHPGLSLRDRGKWLPIWGYASIFRIPNEIFYFWGGIEWEKAISLEKGGGECSICLRYLSDISPICLRYLTDTLRYLTD